MGDSDKTVALKVAYAGVILNTAKEAAARVMVSEKRAALFQHQLNCSKEESLRLLLRLKHMIDVNTIEAETTYLNQKRKIDELEAQLHEAEDIITDLRLELNCVRDELKRAKNTKGKPLSGQVTSEDASSLKDPTTKPTVQSMLNSGYMTVPESDMSNYALNKGYPDRCCSSTKQTDRPNVSHVESYYLHNSNLATVLMASKKLELYRNSCKQRICALERNLLDGKLTPGGLETSVGDERQRMRSSSKAKNLKEMNFSAEETNKSVEVSRIKRRRKTRFSRIKAGSRRFHPGQRTKPCKSSSGLSRCQTYTINRNVKLCDSRTVSSIRVGDVDGTENPTDLEEEFQHKSNCHEDVVERSNDNATSFRSLLDKQLTEPCQSSPVLSFSKTLNSICFNVKSNEDRLKTVETKTKTKPLARLDPGLTLIQCNVDPLSGSKHVTLRFKTHKLGDESVLVRQEGSSGDISTRPSSELSYNSRVNVSLGHSYSKGTKASNVTNDGSTMVDDTNDGILKYNFQRKRKKESLCNLDENTSEESSVKRRAGEKENSPQETSKSNLVKESSRESRRLAQVARQLIALSGKRWW